jgi:hypothetical protein
MSQITIPLISMQSRRRDEHVTTPQTAVVATRPQPALEQRSATAVSLVKTKSVKAELESGTFQIWKSFTSSSNIFRVWIVFQSSIDGKSSPTRIPGSKLDVPAFGSIDHFKGNIDLSLLSRVLRTLLK